jgi:hypothetical protein
MSKRYVMMPDESSSSARTVLVDMGGRVASEARNPIVPKIVKPS